MKRWLLIATLVLGCGPPFQEDAEGDSFGYFIDGEGDGPEDGGRDIGGIPDTPGLGDASADDAGDDAPVDAEPDNGPDIPADPCEGVVCGDHGACVDGTCACDRGYELRDGRCEVYDPGDPALRSEELVCARYAEDFPLTTNQVHTGGGGCEPGTIVPAAHDDAMRRLNLYRWLVGLEPAGSHDGNQRSAQIAAMMMDANNRLSHEPPMTWQCYDPEGARAAGMSNLALGYPNPSESIVGYIEDSGTPSLGHRRWIFFPALNDVGFGHRGRGGAMWAFGRTQRASPSFVAYPPPGPMPIQAIHGAWSFSKPGVGNPTVTVTEVETGRAIEVTSSALRQGFGLDTVSFQLRERVNAGTTYRVQVGPDSYETTPVDCR